jgi:hypothetical protein
VLLNEDVDARVKPAFQSFLVSSQAQKSVIAGLDPAIHLFEMDARIKSAHDDR